MSRIYVIVANGDNDLLHQQALMRTATAVADGKTTISAAAVLPYDADLAHRASEQHAINQAYAHAHNVVTSAVPHE